MENTSAAYNPSKYESAYPQGIEQHYWFKARNRYIHRQLLGLGLDKGKILEVGCATGIVTDFLRRQKIDCWGVELAKVDLMPSIKDFAWAEQDALLLASKFRESVETILLLDVIEHLPEADVFLNSLVKAYAGLKNIVITVPACMEIWSEFDVFYGHFLRYSPASVEQLCARLDFGHHCKYHFFFHALYWSAYLVSSLKKEREITLSAPKKPLEIMLHNWAARFLYEESRFLPSSWKGSSMFIVLKLS